MSRGFICDKCGKAWKAREFIRSYEIFTEEEAKTLSSDIKIYNDEFLASRGIDICPECSKEYINLFVKPGMEIFKRKLEWFGIES